MQQVKTLRRRERKKERKGIWQGEGKSGFNEDNQRNENLRTTSKRNEKEWEKNLKSRREEEWGRVALYKYLIKYREKNGNNWVIKRNEENYLLKSDKENMPKRNNENLWKKNEMNEKGRTIKENELLWKKMKMTRRR